MDLPPVLPPSPAAPPPRKTKRRKKLLIFAIIAIAVIGVALAAVFARHEAVITVQTEKVARRNLTELVVANGRIQPVVQVKISAEVSGEITEMPVKEGNYVRKGDLLVKIKPDFYVAALNQAKAGYESSLAGRTTAAASLEKAEADFKRNSELFRRKLISDAEFIGFKTGRDIAAAQVESARHQGEMARASVASAQDSLDKTTILSPVSGTVSKLNSQPGERVLGTVQNVGTEIMTIADLTEMEARVDIGEIDVVLMSPGQNVRLEVDAFKDRKFTGTVTEIANSSKTTGQFGGGQSQEATKFEVKIRIKEKESFRPGMSVTAEIETRYRTNALTVPIASVTTRLPKDATKKDGAGKSAKTNSPTATATNSSAATNAIAGTNVSTAAGTNAFKSDKKSKDAPKPLEVVFTVNGDHARMVPVKIGISDDSHWEITEGLKEGDEVVSGGYKAINRELEDGKKIHKGTPAKDDEKKSP